MTNIRAMAQGEAETICSLLNVDDPSRGWSAEGGRVRNTYVQFSAFIRELQWWDLHIDTDLARAMPGGHLLTLQIPADITFGTLAAMLMGIQSAQERMRTNRCPACPDDAVMFPGVEALARHTFLAHS